MKVKITVKSGFPGVSLAAFDGELLFIFFDESQFLFFWFDNGFLNFEDSTCYSNGSSDNASSEDL